MFRDAALNAALCRAALEARYGVAWSLPEGHLIPALPSRENYVRWCVRACARARVRKGREGTEREGSLTPTDRPRCLPPCLPPARPPAALPA